MNQPDGSSEPSTDSGSEEDEFVPTPFDGPYLLPVVLFGLAMWFGYDGWINEDESLRQWWWFNQGGAVLFAAWGAWLFVRAQREQAKR